MDEYIGLLVPGRWVVVIAKDSKHYGREGLIVGVTINTAGGFGGFDVRFTFIHPVDERFYFPDEIKAHWQETE
jgi:hypothetical protein